MKTIKLINSKQGWLARFEDDQNVLQLFGTDTLSTAFTEEASPFLVKTEIEKLNPGFKIIFA